MSDRSERTVSGPSARDRDGLLALIDGVRDDFEAYVLAAEQAARDDERARTVAAIVAWLRAAPRAPVHDAIADAIEREFGEGGT